MVRKSLELVFVEQVDELLGHVLERMPDEQAPEGEELPGKGKKKAPRRRGRASAPPPA